MLIVLEFLRVLFILIVGTGILSFWGIWVYDLIGIDLMASSMAWMTSLANLIIVFVIYRNSLQFSGWFKSSKSTKITRRLTIGLLGVSAILLIMPLLNSQM